jgi:MFS family permease
LARAEDEAPTGYRRLIRRNSDFRFLWFGQIISLLGDWLNLIASAALIAMLTESGLAVGALFVIRMLAPFVVSPLAGVVADQFSRKYVLVFSDLARSITVLGFLFVREPDQVWLLYLLVATEAAISAFFFTARSAILPDIVSTAELGAANALGSATWSVMLALGAALGGLLSGLFGVYSAFVIDSFTFLASAFLILRIRRAIKPSHGGAVKTLGDGVRQYVEGLRYLSANADIFLITLHKAALGLMLGPSFNIVLVTISEKVFVLGIGGGIGLGLFLSAEGLGTGIGSIGTRYFTGDRERSLRLAIVVGYLLGSLGLAICAPLISFAGVLIGSLIRGVGGGIVWVFSTQLLLQLVPGQVRGRVFSSELAIFTLLSAIGAGLVGRLLDTSLGISGVAWIISILTLVPACFWTLWILRQAAQKRG